MTNLEKRELLTELIGVDISEWSNAQVDSEMFIQMEDVNNI